MFVYVRCPRFEALGGRFFSTCYFASKPGAQPSSSWT